MMVLVLPPSITIGRIGAMMPPARRGSLQAGINRPSKPLKGQEAFAREAGERVRVLPYRRRAERPASCTPWDSAIELRDASRAIAATARRAGANAAGVGRVRAHRRRRRARRHPT